jgi:hypothetical protein
MTLDLQGLFIRADFSRMNVLNAATPIGNHPKLQPNSQIGETKLGETPL